jgi:predicted GTPase
MSRKKVLIMGAAGRDFHNFNVYFRDNYDYDVIAFTATQIPGIVGRIYPAELAGSLYSGGIPIFDETQLNGLIHLHGIEQVIFAYSDISHEYVMHKASQVIACGADFCLMGLNNTLLKSNRPVISVCAGRTGSGKSQTARAIVSILKRMGKHVAAVRHPMPYGNLALQKVQRFASYADLDRHQTTIEEREEYEPYLDRGAYVYAGVDYGAILEEAAAEADVIVWDGGNNDLPFYKPDFHIVVVDSHRPGHELRYHPGETNIRIANVVIINKVDTANYQDVLTIRQNIHQLNPHAVILEAASPVLIDDGEQIRGSRVLVVEDGPTTTHGEMKYGAGYIAAQRYGAAEILDPRPFAVGSIAETFERYPEIGHVLPAMGYGEAQMHDLEATINQSDADYVIAATPIDLTRIITVDLPMLRVHYELQVIGNIQLEDLIQAKLLQLEKSAEPAF